MIEYFELGEPVCQKNYTPLFPKTRAVLNACKENPFIDVVELRVFQQSSSTTEIIVIDAGDATIEHASPSGIKRNERLAIGISGSTEMPVVVWALRKNFPGLSHLHATPDGEPKALCLYNVAWSTTERSWTPEKLLQRIFWWLKQSAIGKLHRSDQPLEQMFYLSPYQLFLPSDHLKYTAGQENQLAIQSLPNDHGTLRAIPLSSPLYNPDSAGRFQLLPIMIDPLESHEVVAAPRTLGQLQERLSTWGSDLLGPLISSLKTSFGDGAGVLTHKLSAITGLVILVYVPRNRDGVFDRHDVLGYLVLHSPIDLANALNLPLHAVDNKSYLVPLVGNSAAIPQSEQWKNLPVQIVEIRHCVDRKFAQNLSDIETDSANFQGVLAGVGALGSLLADIWAREAWGTWTYVDPDKLLPHNLTRHIAVDAYLGLPKTTVVQRHVADIFPNTATPNAINAGVTDDLDALVTALAAADVLVDVTTTLEVPRDLSVREGVPRIASLFITPSGNGCVLMLEDKDRSLRAWAIEAQYYRAVLTSQWGEGHLVNHQGDIWVGGGCRDISVKISPERIHLHAGVLSRQLRRSLQSLDARACVWTVDEATDAVSHVELPLHTSHAIKREGWTIIYDDGLITKLNQYRDKGLPSETGGMLLGVTDTKSMTILMVDALSAPVDSQASPCHFIRGKEGQHETLKECHQRTANIVDYIGEWHSHPQGCPSTPSHDDKNLLTSLTRRMSADGLPMLMVIVAGDSIGFNLGITPTK
jgi:integrative and conjugative element protein (TIGR02256 family)